MRVLLAGMLGWLALASAPARAQPYAPDGAVMLFAPGSAVVTRGARDVLLAFLRPPCSPTRPPTPPALHSRASLQPCSPPS